MIMLNKKSCINCDEIDLVKHNEEINKILKELRKLDNYDCVVLHKYQDIAHRNKDLQVININLWEIYELVEFADFKNGADFLIDDEGFLNLSVYGQTYKLGGERHFINAIFKIIPHDENFNFLNISDFILEGKPIRFSDKQLNKKKKSTIELLSEYKEKVINSNTIKKDSQTKEKGEER